MLCFSVTDTGLGISAERLPPVCSCAQGDTSTARVYGGTGLGLMICKHLVEMMGGRVSVSSAPGTGSTFRFCVLAQPVALDQVVVPSTAPPPHAAHAERVLVVDDNPVNLQVAAAMLQRLGYPHEGVTGGEAALTAVERAARAGQTFSVVLLDSHMPDLDGMGTARAIRERLGAQTPVLIGISASTLGADRQRCLDAGMSDYLPKPLELELLARTLRYWCQTGPRVPDSSQQIAMDPPAGSRWEFDHAAAACDARSRTIFCPARHCAAMERRCSGRPR
jgi:CheY-like chemotaxis protein